MRARPRLALLIAAALLAALHAPARGEDPAPTSALLLVRDAAGQPVAAELLLVRHGTFAGTIVVPADGVRVPLPGNFPLAGVTAAGALFVVNEPAAALDAGRIVATAAPVGIGWIDPALRSARGIQQLAGRFDVAFGTFSAVDPAGQPLDATLALVPPWHSPQPELQALGAIAGTAPALKLLPGVAVPVIAAVPAIGRVQTRQATSYPASAFGWMLHAHAATADAALAACPSQPWSGGHYRLALRPAGRARIELTDADAPLPADEWVLVVEPFHAWRKAGEILWPVMPAGEYRVRVESGLVGVRRPRWRRVEFDLVVGDGLETETRTGVVRTATITLALRTAAGRCTVADQIQLIAEIAEPYDGDPAEQLLYEPDDAGFFTLEGMPPVRFDLIAMAPAFGQVVVGEFRPRPGDELVHSVRIEVPAPQAVVTFTPADAAAGRRYRIDGIDHEWLVPADGVIRLGGMPPGEHTVELLEGRHTLHRRDAGTNVRVLCTEGGAAAEARVELAPAAWLQLPAPRLRPPLPLWVIENSGRGVLVTPDRPALLPLPPGPAAVLLATAMPENLDAPGRGNPVLWWGDLPPPPAGVAALPSPTRITLPKLTRVTLTWPSGRVPADVALVQMLGDEPNPLLIAGTIWHGTLTTLPLPPGEWRVRWSDATAHEWRFAINADAGDELALTVGE